MLSLYGALAALALIAIGLRWLTPPADTRRLAQWSALHFEFLVPGEYRLSGLSVILLAGISNALAVVAFWLPVGVVVDTAATVGLLFLLLTVGYVHAMNYMPVVPVACLAGFTIIKLATTPATVRPRSRVKQKEALV